MNYWKTCIKEGLSEFGIAATEQQINDLTEWVKIAHDNHGTAHGHDCIPNPLVEENKRLAQQVIDEREKLPCAECKGRGVLVHNSLTRSSIGRCWRCNGEGRYSPRLA